MDARAKRWERRFQLPMLIAALLVIPVIAVEQSDVGEPWRAMAGWLNWAIWLAFLTELIVMLIVVRDKWVWLREHPLEVAVVVLTPPFLPASLQGARVLRLLRLVRLLRLAQLAKRVFSAEGLRWAALLAVLTVLAGGAGFKAAEGREVSTWDGIWWAVTTMTTVGYGDLYPHTNLGRILGMGVMLVGIGFVAVLTAAIAERFLARKVEEEAEVSREVVEEVEEAEAVVLRELRAITTRLRELEALVAKPRPR